MIVTKNFVTTFGMDYFSTSSAYPQEYAQYPGHHSGQYQQIIPQNTDNIPPDPKDNPESNAIATYPTPSYPIPSYSMSSSQMMDEGREMSYNRDPDIRISLSDSQWLTEHVRMIYQMAETITLCFTPDNIFIFLCTKFGADVPFYSASKIDTLQLCFYDYRVKNRDGTPQSFVGVTFSASDFYKNITNKAKHISMEMLYYIREKCFMVKPAVKSISEPEVTIYPCILNVECCIQNLPFIPGCPMFQFNSGSFSSLFTSAATQTCYYMRMEIYEQYLTIRVYNNTETIIMHCAADYPPEGTKGTVTFSTAQRSTPERPPILSLCLASSIIKVLGKISKITPQGANIGAYIVPEKGVLFLEVFLGVIGKNYIGLQTSSKFKDKSFQPYHSITDAPERYGNNNIN